MHLVVTLPANGSLTGHCVCGVTINPRGAGVAIRTRGAGASKFYPPPPPLLLSPEPRVADGHARRRSKALNKKLLIST